MSSSERKIATALVELAKAGDPLAFGRLVIRYRPRIFALALHLTGGSSSDADDITQDVFLKAHLKLDQFEGRSDFFTWLYRMAVNQSMTAHRKSSRIRRLQRDQRLRLALRVDGAISPERKLALRRHYKRLLEALDQLPEDTRTAVILVCTQGFSHAEAAVVLNCAENTISWRVHDARKRLKKLMGNDEASIGLPRSVDFSIV